MRKSIPLIYLNVLAALAVVWVILVAPAMTVVSAQQGTAEAAAQAQAAPFSLGKVFTFLFLTLGPFKIIGPFAAMTRGRDGAFKRRLAFEGILSRRSACSPPPPSAPIPCRIGGGRSERSNWRRASSFS
jgi:hypothetical protein